MIALHIFIIKKFIKIPRHKNTPFPKAKSRRFPLREKRLDLISQNLITSQRKRKHYQIIGIGDKLRNSEQVSMRELVAV